MSYEPGKCYLFFIKNIIRFQDGLKYFVLQGPEKVNHLLDVGMYEEYGFRKGEEIRCRVDKINCSGKMYLEPEHPFYRENEKYPFAFVRKETLAGPFGEPQKYLILNDRMNNEISLQIADPYYNIDPPDILECTVVRIKKARLFLGHPWEYQMNQKISTGETFNFRILENSFEGQRLGYYLLEDPFGQKHVLEMDHYRKYSLEPGTTIRARVVKWDEGRFVLEPEHPVYKDGLCYSFEVSHAENPVDADTGISKILIVKDIFGNEIKVPVKKEQEPVKLMNSEIFRVVEVRKGRPVLELPADGR